MLHCPESLESLYGSPLNAKAFRGFFINAYHAFIKKAKPNGNIRNNRNIGGGMAYIFRLIFICFAFGIVSPGHAETVQKITQYAPSIMSPLVWSNSGSSACSVGLTERKKSDDEVNHYVAGSPFYQAPTTCNVDRVNFLNEVNKGLGSFSLVTRLACPSGSTENPDGSCSSGQCPAGMQQNSSGACVCKPGLEKGPDGICVPTDDTQCKAFYATNSQSGGSLVQDYRLKGNIYNGTTYCMPGQFDNANRGCRVVFERESFIDYGSGHSVTEGQFNAKPGDTGLACNVGDVETPAKPPDEKCKGGYTGTVNGVEVCVSKVPDSGVGSDNNTNTNNDGENTTTTNTNSQTECKDGKCTTTTTVTTTITNNTTGSSTTTTSTGSTTESQGAFCTKNPNGKLCGGNGNGDDRSSFSGSCSAGFKCEGDAIQCSIAQEQHRRACKLFDDKSPESELYDKEKGKEGNQTKDLPGNETIDLQGKIDTSDAIGGDASGVQDLNIVVWGKSVTLPFSQVNSVLDTLGRVLLAVSFLLAIRIVARG